MWCRESAIRRHIAAPAADASVRGPGLSSRIFTLERVVRMRLGELQAEADRERTARRLTAHDLRFEWVH